MTRDQKLALRAILQERIAPLLKTVEGDIATVMQQRFLDLGQLVTALWQFADDQLTDQIAATRPDLSAQPCGCDPGAKWVCARHRT